MPIYKDIANVVCIQVDSRKEKTPLQRQSTPPEILREIGEIGEIGEVKIKSKGYIDYRGGILIQNIYSNA